MTEGGRKEPPAEVRIPGVGTVRPLERHARGKVATVYRASLGDRIVALKVYHPRYIRRHAERHGTNIAEFEFTRNEAFREVPELTRFAARPLGYVHRDDVSAFAQELLEGQMYYDASLRRGGPIPHVFRHLETIVDHAHRHGIFDVDLHAMNVLIVEEDGEEIPKLFDFNRIPFHLDPRNPIESLALRLGVIDERSRDLKKLRQFHDYRKLLRRRARFLPAEPS